MMRTFSPSETRFLARRRAALRQHPTQIGIEYIDVEKGDASTPSIPSTPSTPSTPSNPPKAPNTWELRLFFISKDDGGQKAVPDRIAVSNVRITAGRDVTYTGLRVDSVAITETNPLTIYVTRAADEGTGAFPTYTLQLVDVPNLDPFFDQVSFSLHVDQPAQFDVYQIPSAIPTTPPAPAINYLARDYQTFRQLMLDRLSVVMPQWTERNPAGLGMTVIETLAYAADHLSYYQDAVATEAYLGTARRRISVRRHARLLDYAMHEGCNARAWVQVQVKPGAGPVRLEQGTRMLTRIAGQEPGILSDAAACEHALAEASEVFETLHAVALREAHNRIPLYTWGAHNWTLPQGATRATLQDAWADEKKKTRTLSLQVGEVLIFEEVCSQQTGKATDANPTHRHAVRLTSVRPSADPLGGACLDGPAAAVPIVEITWGEADALPFPLCVSTRLAGDRIDVSLARGNVVLVDHGKTIAQEALLPAVVPEHTPYRPMLQRHDITHRVPYAHAQAQTQSAASALCQDPSAACPVIWLMHNDERWTARRDLLQSDRSAYEFVVEIESDRRCSLRFGDGVRGKCPLAGAELKATYRVGNGLRGNVGSGAIVHVITEDAAQREAIKSVRNPLPAQGGIDPEPLEQVRRDAPQALHNQERAVTAQDCAEIAQRHPQVQRAAAHWRWTGSWHTVFVTVQRVDNRPVDDAFKAEVRAFLDAFRLAGCDMEIQAPRFVPLDLAFTVRVAPEYFCSTVRQALRDTFSAVDLPDGRRGFFHPDALPFGHSIALSQVIAEAMQVPGVAWIEACRFQRCGRPTRDELKTGVIPIGPLEIARLENIPGAPEHGTIAFRLQGGR